MKGTPLNLSGLLASLTLALVAGAPGLAAAQEAKLYEIVENLDTVALLTTGHRVSSWTAQGTAEVGSPFCPGTPKLLSKGVKTCTITAFGTDDIDLSALQTKFIVGTVWANVVSVANDPRLDNVVDAPEVATFSGQLTGDITVLQPDGKPPVQPDLRKNKVLMGPALPLIYVINGKFFADASPVVRTSPPPPSEFPTVGWDAEFGSTFRLPFKVGKSGKREKPERGKAAFYLGDDGSLIKVDKQDEFALGFPLLRAEVFFSK